MVNTILQGERELYPQAKTQQTLQDQQIAAQYNMQTMGMLSEFKQKQALLVEQTNPSKIVDSIMLGLEGKEEVSPGQFKRVGEPVLNEEGLSKIRFQLRSLINQSTVLSHLELEDVGRIAEQFGNNITDELTLNWKRYGIKDKAMLDSIHDAIVIPTFLALKRAEGQNEKNWLSKISVENISNAGRIEQPKKESIWEKFKL